MVGLGFVVILALGVIAFIFWPASKKSPINLLNPKMPQESSSVVDPNLVRCDRFAVYFAFDDSGLTKKTENRLRSVARCMKRNPEATLQIQGHCDERGTRRYNLTLGKLRAEAVKRYLTRLGIPEDRLTTISYGEDRPAVRGSNLAAWEKNRRAKFVELGENS